MSFDRSPRHALKIGIAVAALTVAACGGDGASPGGTGETSSTGTTQGACPVNAGGTSGTKITMKVTWPDTIGIVGGSDEIVVWTRSALTFDGNEVNGEVSACGSSVPPLQTTEAFGSHFIQPVIPNEVWDSGMIPTTDAKGTISGFDPGATISMEPAGTVLGATMADPMEGEWPNSWLGLELDDADGSGQPGMTAYPHDAEGFAMPPLDLSANGAHADALYLATRSVFELQGTRDSCTTASGNVIVHAFDNHIVGCHVAGGDECTEAQVSFVDSNRTVYEITSASYEMAQVSDDATCADVRAALP